MNAQEITIQNEAILIADSHHGQYIPQLITKGELNNPLWDWSEVSEEDINSLLTGPEDDFYWEAWNNAESQIKITSEEGVKYFLCQNDDLWAIPEDCADQLEDWVI
jgi:hypothetical protein